MPCLCFLIGLYATFFLPFSIIAIVVIIVQDCPHAAPEVVHIRHLSADYSCILLRCLPFPILFQGLIFALIP